MAHGLARFQASLQSIVAQVRGIDLRSYEIAALERIVGELKPATLELLVRARALLGEVLEACESTGAGSDPDEATPYGGMADVGFELRIDASVAAGLGSSEVVEEIAFVAQLELRQRWQRLAALDLTQDTLTVLGECDSCLRRIRKALSAVENAIAKAEGSARLLDFASELQTSLIVRRAYAKWSARLLAGGDPGHETLYSRLRGAGTQIAILLGWEAYPEMRVRDRLLLRDLQQRVLAWLRGGEAAVAADGMRLWQDLAACVALFAQVNRRQELVEHDGRAVRDALTRLRARGEAAALDPCVRQLLESLEGLDPELDGLLASGARQPACRHVAVLERLAEGFGCGEKDSVPW